MITANLHAFYLLRPKSRAHRSNKVQLRVDTCEADSKVYFRGATWLHLAVVWLDIVRCWRKKQPEECRYLPVTEFAIYLLPKSSCQRYFKKHFLKYISVHLVLVPTEQKVPMYMQKEPAESIR